LVFLSLKIRPVKKKIRDCYGTVICVLLAKIIYGHRGLEKKMEREGEIGHLGSLRGGDPFQAMARGIEPRKAKTKTSGAHCGPREGLSQASEEKGKKRRYHSSVLMLIE
jgi:hypothetical protein